MKRLSLSRKDRVILGVCGGIAEYFNISSTLVRFLAILLFLSGGIGFFAYVIIAFVISQSN